MKYSLRKITFSMFAYMVMMLVMPGLSFADGDLHVLTAEQWNVPRQASSILSMPALQSAMQAFQAKEGSQLLVKYPGGDEGTLWAYELRGWLISLGVASDNIELIPGSTKPDQLEISIIQPK